MLKFLQGLFYLVVIMASVFAAWFYWTGMMPERMKGTVSPAGMEVQLRVTGTRDWRPEFNTKLFLYRPDGDRFVYDLQTLETREALDQLISSLQWIDGDTLIFTHYPRSKLVTVSYRDGLWNLSEEKR